MDSIREDHNAISYVQGRVFLAACSLIIFVLSVVPVNEEFLPPGIAYDKVVHFFLYTVLSMAAVSAFLSRAHPYLAGFAYAVFFGIMIEAVQYMLPYRSCELWDVTLNILGAGCGTALFYLRFPQKRSKPDIKSRRLHVEKGIVKHQRQGPFSHLVQMFDATAQRFPRRTAVVFGAKKIAYNRLCDTTQRLASAFRKMGVTKGMRVALWLPNCPEFIFSYFAVLRLGAVIVPVNSMFKREEAKYVIEQSGARVLICSVDKIDHARTILSRVAGLEFLVCVPFCDKTSSEKIRDFNDLLQNEPPFKGFVSISPADTAEILYTSGTTGFPKGAVLTHGNLLANVADSARAIEVTHKDAFLCILPLFHSFASTVCMLLPFRCGATVVIMRTIRPFKRMIRAIFKNRVTVFVGVPSLYAIFGSIRLSAMRLFLARFFNPVRICISGAAALPQQTLRAFEARFKRPLLEGYGLTEASPVVSLNPLKGKRKPGSVGIPYPSLSIRIDTSWKNGFSSGEAGELLLKGPSVMQGYYRMDKETEEALQDGWLRTGDLARVDEEGYLYIIDRVKDMINVRGLNVYPKEIEELLYTHPKITEAAVVGVSHRHRGEVPVTFVVCSSPVSGRELMQYLRANLASYKIPLKVVFRDALPKNAAGKILKRQLREEASRFFSS